ncbi:MAG: cytochrome c oxidase subunit II [Nitrospirae bacterium]|nr:cytochrome c oxidase subunit II [Nitrospirota bacterium]
MKSILTLMAAVLLLLPSLASAEGAALVDPVKSWDNHWNMFLTIVTTLWAFVTALVIYMSLKYRRKKGQGDGAYIHGNILLEVIWTAVPLIIIIFLGVQSWNVYRQQITVPKDAYEVNVEGFMWGWNVTYPEGLKTINEIRVPVGRPVKVNLTSKDVLHAFYIPAFRIQEEAIPGRTTNIWFNPVQKGEYTAYCTEFCGSGHSLMLAKVIVMEKTDFETWQGKQKEGMVLSPLDKGKKLIADLGCLGCHNITGEKTAAPTFKGISGRETILADGRTVKADDSYMANHIKDPKSTTVKGYSQSMPPYNLSDEEINAVTTYLKTL